MAAEISVLGFCDGFQVIVKKEGEAEKRFSFDDEETKEGLKDLFEYLGFKTTYEDSY